MTKDRYSDRDDPESLRLAEKLLFPECQRDGGRHSTRNAAADHDGQLWVIDFLVVGDGDEHAARGTYADVPLR